MPVNGTISMPDKDLKGLTIVFTPGTGAVSKDKSAVPNYRPASGTIEAGGAFKLWTENPGDGAAAGKYRVSLSLDAFSSPDDPRAKGIPEVYLDPASSPLQAEVKDTGPNDLKLALDPKATTSTGASDTLSTPVGIAP